MHQLIAAFDPGAADIIFGIYYNEERATYLDMARRRDAGRLTNSVVRLGGTSCALGAPEALEAGGEVSSYQQKSGEVHLSGWQFPFSASNGKQIIPAGYDKPLTSTA